MKKFVALVLSTALFLPSIVFAQPSTFAELVDVIISIINPLFMLSISLIFLMFLWGLAKFIFSLGNSKSIDDGKQLMFWGIIALFLVLSVWGIVAILRNTFLGP